MNDLDARFMEVLSGELAKTEKEISEQKKENRSWFNWELSKEIFSGYSSSPEVKNLNANKWKEVLLQDNNKLRFIYKKKSETKNPVHDVLYDRSVAIQKLIIIQKIIHKNEGNLDFERKQEFEQIRNDLKAAECQMFMREQMLKSSSSADQSLKINLTSEDVELLNECDLFDDELKAFRTLIDKRKSEGISSNEDELDRLNKAYKEYEERFVGTLEKLIEKQAVLIETLQVKLTENEEVDFQKSTKEQLTTLINKQSKDKARLSEVKLELENLLMDLNSKQIENNNKRLLEKLSDLENQITAQKNKQKKSSTNVEINKDLIELLVQLSDTSEEIKKNWGKKSKNVHNAEEKKEVDLAIKKYDVLLSLYKREISSLQTFNECLLKRPSKNEKCSLADCKSCLSAIDQSLRAHQEEAKQIEKILNESKDVFNKDPSNPLKNKLEERLKEINQNKLFLANGAALFQKIYREFSKAEFKTNFFERIERLHDVDRVAFPSVIDHLSKNLSEAFEKDFGDFGNIYKWKTRDWAKLLSDAETNGNVEVKLNEIREKLSLNEQMFQEAKGMPPATRTALEIEQRTLKLECALLTDQLALQRNFSSFALEVDSHKNRIAKSQARQEVLREKIGSLNDKISAKHTVIEKDKLIKWRDHLRGLQLESRNAEKEEKLLLRETVLTRLLECINQQQCRIIQLQEQESALKKNIEENEKKLLNRSYSEPEIDQIKNALKIESEELAHLEKKLTSLKSENSILSQTFEKQLEKYEKIQRPKKSFQKALTEVAVNTLQEAVTLGIFKNRQKSPADFRLQKQFADLGYTMATALKSDEWKKGNNTAEIIKNNVQDFLKWADNHPKAASSLAGDIALTVSLLGDESTLDLLITGMRTRMNTYAALGGLGREAEVEVIVLSDLRFQALADLAHYGPLAVSATNILKESVNGLISAGVPGLVVGGLQALAGGAKNTLIQKAIQEISSDHLEAVSSTLQAIRGDSLPEILVSNQVSALIRFAGDVRLGVMRPKTVIEGIQRRIQMLQEIFKESSTIARGVQIVIAVGAPVLGLSTLALPFILPVGLPIALVIGVAALGLAGLAVFSPLTLIRRIFPNAASRAQNKIIKAASEKYRDQIREQSTLYIQKLKDKKVIVENEIPELPKEFLDEFTQVEQKNLIENLINESKQSLNKAIADEEKELKDQLIPSEIAALYTKFDFEKIVKAELDRYKEKIDSFPKKVLADHRFEFEGYLIATIKAELVDEWLLKVVDKAFQHEFEVILSSYDSPEQYAASRIPRDQKELEQLKAKAEDNLDVQLRDGLNLSSEQVKEYKQSLDA